jgi:copper homeostasis protein
LLEVATFDINACVVAQNAGANRIELCANPYEGGTTPSYGLIKIAKEKLSIPVHVMIRPRGGNFLYNDEEFDVLKSEIKVCKVFGCNGIVIGLLHQNGNIDIERCKQIVALAYPLQVTFHRAFDSVNNWQQALEDVILSGCTSILTSGLQASALAGMQTIAQMVQQANNRITIMPGGGVRSNNIAAIQLATAATVFHTAASIKLPSNMQYVNNQLNDDAITFSVDALEVQKMVTTLQSAGQK